MPEIQCRHFSGYKPCTKGSLCDSRCPSRSVPDVRVLVVSLEALGAVLRSTVILEPLRKKYPDAHVTWITEASAKPLLEQNPLIDRLLVADAGGALAMDVLEFDIAFVVDKSLKAAGLAKRAKKVFGFTVDSRSGSILPATEAAAELWELGLSNDKKFYLNTKPETQLLIEALELGPFKNTPYLLRLSDDERRVVQMRRREWQRHDQRVVLGINTGSSNVIPYKRFTPKFQREIIRDLQSFSNLQVVLLGGRDETEMNREIASGFPNVIGSPLDRGLRDGILSVAACDLVLSGDSLGMHLGIALQKWVIAWFGPTCAQEIDLYGRGRKILTAAPCSPCWKRVCQKNPMCYDQVSRVEVIKAIKEGIECQTSSSKQPILATSSSLSPSFGP